MLGICRSDEPYLELPGTCALKNELARQLYTLMDEFEDLRVNDLEEVLEAARKYFRFGEEKHFEEDSPYVDD